MEGWADGAPGAALAASAKMVIVASAAVVSPTAVRGPGVLSSAVRDLRCVAIPDGLLSDAAWCGTVTKGRSQGKAGVRLAPIPFRNQLLFSLSVIRELRGKRGRTGRRCRCGRLDSGGDEQPL